MELVLLQKAAARRIQYLPPALAQLESTTCSGDGITACVKVLFADRLASRLHWPSTESIAKLEVGHT